MRATCLFALTLMIAGCQSSQGGRASAVKEFDALMTAQTLDVNGCPSAQMSRSQISHAEAVNRCACAGDIAKAVTSPDDKAAIMPLLLKMQNGTVDLSEIATLSELVEPAKQQSVNVCKIAP